MPRSLSKAFILGSGSTVMPGLITEMREVAIPN